MDADSSLPPRIRCRPAHRDADIKAGHTLMTAESSHTMHKPGLPVREGRMKQSRSEMMFCARRRLRRFRKRNPLACNCLTQRAPVITNAAVRPLTGWLTRRRMHTSRSTRRAFSGDASTFGMRFRATCRHAYPFAFRRGITRPTSRAHGEPWREAYHFACQAIAGKTDRAERSLSQHFEQQVPSANLRGKARQKWDLSKQIDSRQKWD